MKTAPAPEAIELLVPNFKRRLSGVTSTIVQLVPPLSERFALVCVGTGLPVSFPMLRKRDLWMLWKPPANRPFRIWHARRNVEMIAGVIMRDVLRMKLKLVFTSAAQRHHRPLTKWLIRRMNKVIATSERSGQFLDVPHTISHHGVDTGRFTPDGSKANPSWLPQDALVLGYSGRIRHQKGTDLFVDAAIHLLPSHPDWYAVITGRATAEHREFRQKLQDRIDQAGLGDRIRFIGEVQDIVPWYRRFDLFVAPSRNEGFGLTPLEAMACGTPCVTSNAGAYKELIASDQTGVTTSAGDGEALCAAIRTYMENPDRRNQHSRNCESHVVANFSLDKEVNALSGIYRHMWSHQ